MQTVLVTGCAGFIGSHLSESLLSKGFRVLGIDNFDPFYKRSIKGRNLAHFLGHPSFSFAELDLAEKDKLATFLSGKKIDLIVHLAGKAGVRPSIDDPAGYTRANITATQNILDIMKEKGIRKMAFASSSSVYGNCPEIPFREDMDVSHPVSPYAFTKKSCELINYTYHYLYQLDILNMRFFTVFGPRQRPDLAIYKFTRLLRNNEPIPMFGDGGTARDYTFVTDTVAGIESAIDYLLEHENVYDTVNLGNNQPVLLRDMIQTIADEAGVEPVVNQLPMQDGDVNITYADISRAKQLLGYQPKTPFREGIKQFLAWYDEVHPD
ncbi:GDP-mannose 4,6-dehydratase [Prolixibacter sp. SD074]|jgi:nucleoside-diphosphate-sugar epimerase|uniref:GDP-mannose 4,6-dehydratase n=1 Tax=Prolixibacter sp. SD074 TaxID=2652391 RepID=UPI0012897966|nr:GDP-mannose 4,6-dehydratase [Prolixibacter sp. SD074]GET30165.1 epimerase [Prolixibacter sp. SD074]